MTAKRPYHLEVCVDSAEGCRIASDSGATRIELSIELAQDGLTPSTTLIADCLAITSLPIIVLVRSRPGDFLFNDEDCLQMLQQSSTIAQMGVAGLAIGALASSTTTTGQPFDHQSPNRTYNLNLPFLQSVADSVACSNASRTMTDFELVMHRAFDWVCNPLESLHQLNTIGFTRVLTSGGPPTAAAGVNQLNSLINTNSIEILPGGGIGPQNAKAILEITGCKQLHGSFQKNPGSKSQISSRISALPDPIAIMQTREILEQYFTHS